MPRIKPCEKQEPCHLHHELMSSPSRFVAILGLSWCLICGQAPGRTPGDAEKPLSLAEAIGIALDENRSIAIARQGLKASEAGLGRAHAPDLPSLTANTSIANSARNTAPGPATSLTPSLSLAYDLGTDGAKGGNLAIADLQARIAELEVARQVDQFAWTSQTPTTTPSKPTNRCA